MDKQPIRAIFNGVQQGREPFELWTILEAIEGQANLFAAAPAMYGDLSSGAVIVTTKSYFSGLRDKNMRVSAMNEKKEEEKMRFLKNRISK